MRLLFEAKVARFLKRRQCHPTQAFTKTERGVETTMEVAGTTELKTWVLGWEDQVEVLEPEGLRPEVLAEAGRVVGKYRRD